MPLRRRHPRLGPLLALLAAAALVGALAPPASAVAVNRTWDARLGGSSGTASLRSYTDGTGRLTLDIAGFMAGATLPVIVYRGSCTTPTTIARFNPDEKTGVALRATFIINPMGVICYQVVIHVNVGRSVEETLRVLKALRTERLCPSDWKPGDATGDLALKY